MLSSFIHLYNFWYPQYPRNKIKLELPNNKALWPNRMRVRLSTIRV